MFFLSFFSNVYYEWLLQIIINVIKEVFGIWSTKDGKSNMKRLKAGNGGGNEEVAISFKNFIMPGKAL